jgi:imidazolonepropionase
MTLRWDLLLTHATLATLDGEQPFGLIEDGALACADGRIAWVGRMSDLPAAASAARSENLAGKLLTPGLIDCHTHLVFAGNRAGEFDMRLNGASYEDIARAGGGIASSVAAVRAASEEELLQQSLPRARALLRDGVTTLEIKSGYGLDLANEGKMLRVARRLGETVGVGVRTTYLAAHALPPEFIGDADGYIDAVID